MCLVVSILTCHVGDWGFGSLIGNQMLNSLVILLLQKVSAWQIDRGLPPLEVCIFSLGDQSVL